MSDEIKTYLMAPLSIGIEPAPMVKRFRWLATFLAAVETGFWPLTWYRKQIPFRVLPSNPRPPSPLPPVATKSRLILDQPPSGASGRRGQIHRGDHETILSSVPSRGIDGLTQRASHT